MFFFCLKGTFFIFSDFFSAPLSKNVFKRCYLIRTTYFKFKILYKGMTMNDKFDQKWFLIITMYKELFYIFITDLYGV